MRALVSVSLFFLGIQALNEWSYSGEDGLEQTLWPEKYPDCGGKRQSPIDLKRRDALFNSSLKALRMVNYDEELELPMTNNGHTVQITLPHTMEMTDSDGTVFVSKQMHLHWGGKNSEVSGSEHTIDGMRTMMEIHVVHFNKKYETYENAQNQEDGLAVLAALVKVDNYEENTYFGSLISELENVKYPGQTTTLKKVNIRNMLPADIIHYYTYPGSLTTPPCTQNVKWFVFRDSPTLSKAQAEKIENALMDYNNKTMGNIYRSTQSLHGRVVETNSPDQFPDESEKYHFHTSHSHKWIPPGLKWKKSKRKNHSYLSWK